MTVVMCILCNAVCVLAHRTTFCIYTHIYPLLYSGFAENLSAELNYLHHLRANTLERVMVQLDLCSVGDLVEKHALSTALSRQYCQEILTNYVKLINLEEMQTKVDIAQYDLHYLKLVAVVKPAVPVPQSLVSNKRTMGSDSKRLMVAKV